MKNNNDGIGIIGFFDILGYSSFIENNSTSEASRIILDVILNAEKNVKEVHRELFHKVDNSEKEMLRSLIDQIKWLIFSDTILLTFPYDQKFDYSVKRTLWVIFLSHCSFLYTHLFLEGLPVRGTITHGDFYLAKNCFAGKAIIDAYNETKELNLSAIIFSEKSKKEIEENFDLKELSSFLHAYLVPFKNQKESKRLTLIPAAKFIENTLDIRQLIFDSFWKYNKDIPQSASIKINNTEMFLRSIRKKVGP